EVSFTDLDLDDRLLRALRSLQFQAPTPVQVAAIPQVLAGKDVLARARTGSGKTAAYCLPVAHQLLKRRERGSTEAATRAVIIVPSRELAVQVETHLKNLLAYCHQSVRVLNLAEQMALHLQKPLLNEKPDIVVTTAPRLVQHLQAGHVQLRDTLEFLVIDEADLVFSYGMVDDIKAIVAHLPKIYQSILMSATLTQEIQDLQQLMLRNPVVLKVQDEVEAQHAISHFSVQCDEVSKFVLLYVILKLGLLPGKCLIFV
ncbi:P-loop containing nucleoside triphosphate hydrolase protein, partial [Dimargaris cristalligena]